MRHQRQITNSQRLAGDRVRKLPDGRLLVTAFNEATKVIDAEGNEIMPSPTEIVALKLISEMFFPRKFRTEGRFAA